MILMTRNKRVLFCNEASWMATGYSVYGKEVLSRLNQVSGLEVAELAIYAPMDDPKIKDVPWKVYANKPPASDTKGNKLYNSNLTNRII